VDGVYREDYPKPESAKKALRAVIRMMDADVLALQEMGARPYLDELQRDLQAEGLNYPHAELMEAADTERHVAVLSKRPIASVRKHSDLTFSYFGATDTVKRGMLELRFTTEGGELTLFIVHLKSRFTDRPDDPESLKRRSGEATAVRDRVLKIFPNPAAASFLIVGDCNDTLSSRPLRALMRRGNTQIVKPVPAVDSRGEVWTHFYRKEETYSRVDYILVSPGLWPAVVEGAARIGDSTEVRDASDHRPVAVTLDFPAAK
jgi:endonuclease/exonuclease/phosphatase family metal-dependent hydrolase